VLVAGSLLLPACTSGATHSSGSSSVPLAERPSSVEVSACARDHPASWMGCLVKSAPGFGAVPISGLTLPGAHNAGTFNLDRQAFDTQRGSVCTDFAPEHAKLGNVFSRWHMTQDETITEQLDHGVRFIDLQVAYNGNGSPTQGWRVVESQFSQWPLYDYLDQIAEWAKHHPSEVVIVDFRQICYDNQPSPAIADGLFSNFATPSDVGGGTTTMADVAYDASKTTQSFATTTIDQIVRQNGGGHNVVVLIPNDVRDAAPLASKYHVGAVFTADAASKPSSTVLAVRRFALTFSPITRTGFVDANARLATFPLRANPPLGSQVGIGLSVVPLVYTFDPAKQTSLFNTFGGLIISAKTSTSPNRHQTPRTLPPWEAGLWDPAGTGAMSTSQILATWGHRANVVLADGIEHGTYVPAVIALNAK